MRSLLRIKQGPFMDDGYDGSSNWSYNPDTSSYDHVTTPSTPAAPTTPTSTPTSNNNNHNTSGTTATPVVTGTGGLTPDQQSAQDYINNPSSGQGGISTYVNTQQQRYNDALTSGNTDLVNKLMQDSQRVGYRLSYPSSGSPATGTTGSSSAPGTPPAGGGSSIGAQMNQAAQYNVNDPNFLNKSADERLQIFQSNPALAQQELERIKGVYNQNAGSGDTARLQQITNWANQVRNASGIGANDPFYGNGPAPTADGSLHLNVNNQAQPDVQTYKGTSYDTADKIAKALGLSYTLDPKTGMPIIGGKQFNAITFDANGNPEVPTALVAQALGYTVSYDDKNKTVSISGGPNPKQINDLPQQPGVPAVKPGVGTDPTAAWNTYWNSQDSQTPSTMPIQQQFTPDWTNYYQQAHAQIDPLYNTQYNDLMSKQAGDISGMDQKMNARGIFTSGIAQAAEDDLRAKTTNSVASLFNKQMSDIEKTAQTLYTQAYKQYSDGNTFALKYNQDQITNYMNQQKQVFTQWLSTQKLDLSQQQYALNAWDKMANYQLNQMKAMLPYQQQTANNAANNATSMAKALLPYQSMTVYQQATTQEKQQMDAAINYFKQLGINIDTSKLMESIRHNQAGEQNAADSLQLKLYDMMGFDQNGTPTLKRDQLMETISKDNAAIDTARTNATNAENRTVIDGIGKQLSAVNSQITAIYNSGTLSSNDANAKQAANADLLKLSGKRDEYIGQLKQFTDKGTHNYTPNFPAASQ